MAINMIPSLFKSKATALAPGDTNITLTADYIAYHAALHPADVAIIQNGTKITYAQMHRDLGRFLRAARGFELTAGNRVAIEWTSLYHHWLLVLSFETLGAVTFSYAKSEMAVLRPVLANVDLIIGTEDALQIGARRAQQITQQWIDEVLALEPDNDFRPPQLGPDSPTRLHCSSGTTGEMKSMIRTVKVNEYRIWQYQEKEGYSRHSRYILGLPFSVHAVFGRATACIRMGGTCVYDTDNLIQALSNYDATHIALLPNHLATILDLLPENFVKPKLLTVSTFGAAVPSRLRARALQDLAADLIESYGTNEVGTICTIGRDRNGIVLPGVKVEVVDEHDQPLIDQPGHIRVKSDGCIAGYDSDIDSTARMFRNGWFYPGDIGVMVDARTLKFLGRADDLLNIGGSTIDPVELEDSLRDIASLKDLCITSITDDSGNDRTWVALVLDTPEKLQDIVKIAAPKLPRTLGKTTFISVKHIPRTPNGKIKRDKVKALISESLKTRPTA